MTNNWPEILGILLAAFGLALISLIETALVSVSPVRLRQLSEQGHRTAPLVEAWVGHAQELLGGLVVAINICVLLIANLTTLLAVRGPWGPGAIAWLNLVVLAGTLIFCEIIPKTISVYYAEGIALRTARLVWGINALLYPIVIVLNGISRGILRLLIGLHLLRGSITPAPTAYSEEDIMDLVSAGEQSGEVETSEREMIHGVIEFAETAAREIMVPRPDVVALPVEASLEEAIGVFMSSGHSRVPVYEEGADDILGLLYVKDLLIRLHHAQTHHEPLPAITELLRPAYFVPESKKSDELLREMQQKQVHLAVVVDEYGGTAGIITIEDLLEEIVGDIIDEYDKERLEVLRLPDGSVSVDGRASLEKIEETFNIPIPETEAETISGLITEQLGRIPEPGDRAVINGVEFTVQEVAHNRVERLRAVVLPPEAY